MYRLKKSSLLTRVCASGGFPFVCFMLCPLMFLQVMREVCVNGGVDVDGAGSGSPVHKPELEKVNMSIH